MSEHRGTAIGRHRAPRLSRRSWQALTTPYEGSVGAHRWARDEDWMRDTTAPRLPRALLVRPL